MALFDLPETDYDDVRCAYCGNRAHCAYLTVRTPRLKAHACRCEDCVLPPSGDASFHLLDAGLRATYAAMNPKEDDIEY